MSLYVFSIYPDRAIVSADTRMSYQDNGQVYRLHDHEKKLYIVGDFIITLGGIAWIGKHIVRAFESSGSRSIQQLHQITLDTVSRLDALAYQIGAPHGQYRGNPYALELCVLHYDKVANHNVFYNIATYKGYRLERFDVDGLVHPHVRCYGGIDTQYVEDYFHAHPDEVRQNYLGALQKGYSAAASEKIGGHLIVATQTGYGITTKSYPIEDQRPIIDYADLIGHNIAGQNLHMECFSPSGEVTQFKFDSTGAFLNNSRMYLQSDKGGRIGLDPNTGFIAGNSSLFTITTTGIIHPSCLDDDGNIIFDKDGLPQNTNVYIGIDGKAYFRGDIYAENGFFNGIIQVQDIQDKSGNSMLTKNGQIAGEHLDLRGVNIVNEAGETMITIDETGMHFMPGHSPVKYQFSTSLNGPWRDTYATNDEYRRESFDGGTTWEAPYKLVGKDGRPGADGSDANVTFNNIKSALSKAYGTQTSFMTVDEMGAPEIFGGKIYGAEIYAGGVGKKGGQVIGLTSSGIDVFDGRGEKSLGINAEGDSVNLTTGFKYMALNTPYLNLEGTNTTFFRGLSVDFTGVKEADFTGVKTKGLHVTFE